MSFSLIVMKTLPAMLIASSTVVLALAGQCQSGPKKDAKPQDSSSIVAQKSAPASSKEAPSAFGSHLEPILKTVSASEEQRKSITAIVDEFRARIVPLRQKHDELRDQFLKSLTSGQPGDVVLANQAEFIRAQADLNAQYLALRLKVSQVLTEEQNTKFSEYRKRQGWKTAEK
jgi:Spy/CpxP family protein refolding chaperone